MSAYKECVLGCERTIPGCFERNQSEQDPPKQTPSEQNQSENPGRPSETPSEKASEPSGNRFDLPGKIHDKDPESQALVERIEAAEDRIRKLTEKANDLRFDLMAAFTDKASIGVVQSVSDALQRTMEDVKVQWQRVETAEKSLRARGSSYQAPTPQPSPQN